MTAWLEQAWLIQYLDRELAGEEAHWFEAYAMDRPELLIFIEADTRLRDALAAAASIRPMEGSADGGGRPGGATQTSDAMRAGQRDESHGVSNTPASTSDRKRRPSLITRFRPRSQSAVHTRRVPPTWLAMAASLLIGLGVGLIGVRARDVGSAPPIIASPTRIIYDTMRGEVTPPRIEHADSESPYVLIEIAVPTSAEQITLRIGDASEQALSLSPDGVVTFLANRNTLAATPEATVTYIAGGRTRTRSISLQSKGSLK